MEAEWIFNGPCTTCKITNERPCITSLLICINLNFHQLCHWTSVTVLHVVKITNSQLTTSDFRSVRCCIHSVWMTLYVWHKVTKPAKIYSCPRLFSLCILSIQIIPSCLQKIIPFVLSVRKCCFPECETWIRNAAWRIRVAAVFVGALPYSFRLTPSPCTNSCILWD